MPANAGIVLISRDPPPAVSSPDLIVPRIQGHDAGRPPVLHGLQLWIALPEAERHGEPRFAHHADLPVARDGAASVTVAIGEYRGERSPAEVFEDWVAGRFPVVHGHPGSPARRASAASRTPQAPLTLRLLA